MDYPEIDADKDLNRPVEELTRKFYRDIMKSYERTTKDFAATMRDLQEMLVDIAGIVDSKWMHEQRGVKMRDPRKIGILELMPIVRAAAIEAHIEKTRIREKYADQEVLMEEKRMLAARLETVEREKVALSTALNNRDTVIKNLKNQLASVQKGERLDVPTDNEMMLPTTDDEIAAHYQLFIGERLSPPCFFAIEKIGLSGEIRSPDIRRLIGEHLGSPDDGKRVYDVLELCEKYGIVNKYLPDRGSEKSSGGRPPHIYYLDPMIGAYFFEQNTGKKYVMPEYVKSHGYGQSLLVMEAEDILREVGYEILKPQQMKNSDGTGQYFPDITATRNGIMIYCEVERFTPRGNQDPDSKWRNFRQYSNGQMYVFVDDHRSTQQSLRYAGSAMTHPNDRVYICEIKRARDHLRDKGTIWTTVHDSKNRPVRDHEM